jgi:hypothetical protein
MVTDIRQVINGRQVSSWENRSNSFHFKQINSSLVRHHMRKYIDQKRVMYTAYVTLLYLRE